MMQKKNRNLFLALVWSAVFAVSYAQSAHAQAIFMRDDDDDRLNGHLANIQGGITGYGSYMTGAFAPDFSTNAFLSYNTVATPTYNTNNMLWQVESEIGGCSKDSANCSYPKSGTAITGLGTVAPEKGVGTSTPYFNTNTLLRNAFLGVRGTEEKIEKYDNLIDNGALLTAPTPIEKADSAASSFSSNIHLPAASSSALGSSKVMVGVMTKDVLKNADQAVKSAVAKGIPTPDSLTVKDTINADAWKNRCDNGFNPTDDATTITLPGGTTTIADREGAINVGLKCGTPRYPGHARQDRSLESLLGPLEYLAPATMALPTGAHGQTLYKRFPTITEEKYYPIYAAAGFCQNITQNASPALNVGTKDENTKDALNRAMLHETADSRIAANCWHFFEERVQYPSDSGAPRFAEQKARCKDDYEIRHIIDKNAWTDCQSNGRSALQARADMAYRLDSAEYVNYLNTLGVAVREQLMAGALDAPERFEQSLLMERMVMSAAMAAARSEAQIYGKASEKNLAEPVGGGMTRGQ